MILLLKRIDSTIKVDCVGANGLKKVIATLLE